MQLPEDSPEQIQKKREQISEKRTAATRAVHATLREFLAPEPTATQQLDLAYRLLVYMQEVIFQDSDVNDSLNRLRGRQEFDEDTIVLKDAAHEMETAAYHAHNGDYTELMGILALYGDQKIGEITDQEEYPKLKELFYQRLSSLPDQGIPLTERITPAFQDPRFNGENDALEE